jgi:DNA topoisomerase I
MVNVDRSMSPAVESARSAGLRYVRGDMPGLSRRKRGRGRGFVIVDEHGAVVHDTAVLRRVRALVIPPAWRDVWICPLENGHLQATGRDARGRKQYRYHPKFRAVRDANKFERLAAFARVLPNIRAKVDADLADTSAGLARDRVLATIVKLLELTRVRVGNDEYVRENGSYGLTTLVDEHAQIRGNALKLRFKGKSGVIHDVTVKHPRIARIVRACQDLPGQELFQWVDDDGAVHPVHSDDVNAYIRAAAGADFTAKDFRTWAGTVHAALTLLAVNSARCANARDVKKCIVRAIEETAHELRNRPATCRKYYVHPAVLDAFSRGELAQALAGDDVEAALLRLLDATASTPRRPAYRAPRRRASPTRRAPRPQRRSPSSPWPRRVARAAPTPPRKKRPSPSSATRAASPRTARDRARPRPTRRPSAR